MLEQMASHIMIGVQGSYTKNVGGCYMHKSIFHLFILFFNFTIETEKIT